MYLDDYTLTKFLGKGTFGEVYLTTKKGSDCVYATKRMEVKFVEDPKYIKYFKNEIAILRKLYHKNIIKLEDLKKTTNHYYVIMEYCNGGTLTECLEKYKTLYHRPFTEEIVQHIMRQVVSAINYMHDLKIIHRDLKLDNILVKFDNEMDKNQMNLLKAEIKIIDFGFAAYKDQTGLLQTAIGSPLNMDPLILKKFNSGGSVNKELGYDEKADIWSLGTIFYQLLIGDSAFNAFNLKELVSKIEEGTYKVPTNLSKESVSFLISMLQYKPEKRKSASELIKHAFLIKNVNDFTHINMNQVSNKVYNGELKINIKENNTIWNVFNGDGELNLNKAPSDFSPTETPITESQYISKNDLNNKGMISSAPFDSEKNFIDKEFSQASSTPIPGLNFDKSNNSPNNNGFLRTPTKPGVANQNINNIQNQRNMQMPQFLGQNGLQINGNNMITILKKLDNGQVIKTQVTLEQYRQLQQQNGQNQINLMNKFQQIPVNPNQQKTPVKGIIASNVNQINQLQYPQRVLPPHGLVQNPHGPPLGQIQSVAHNQMQLNKNPQNQAAQMNLVQLSRIPQNQITTPNKMANNQISQMNKLQPNQISPNQNLVNPNIQMRQAGMNKIQQIGVNLQQENTIRKVITMPPNRQNNPLQNVKTPIQTGQLGLRQPQMKQVPQIRQVNTMNQGILNSMQNKMIQPQLQINTPQKGLIQPQQQIKNIPMAVNQVNASMAVNKVNPLGNLYQKFKTINDNNRAMNNTSFDNPNKRANNHLGNAVPNMPNANKIFPIQPIPRNGISPFRVFNRPNPLNKQY